MISRWLKEHYARCLVYECVFCWLHKSNVELHPVLWFRETFLWRREVIGGVTPFKLSYEWRCDCCHKSVQNRVFYRHTVVYRFTDGEALPMKLSVCKDCMLKSLLPDKTVITVYYNSEPLLTRWRQRWKDVVKKVPATR